MRERLLDDKGEIRRFVNIYLNGDDIRFLDQLNSKVKDGDDISIVPAIAGGRLAATTFRSRARTACSI